MTCSNSTVPAEPKKPPPESTFRPDCKL
jgi:hypothetical protein